MRRDDLYVADEAFLTGTAAEIVPIGSVDDRVVGNGLPGPITKAIQATYHQAVRGELAQYESWLTRI
jgi:branched-chain amino acid aminotransferase